MVTCQYPETIDGLESLRGSFVADGEVCLLHQQGLPDFESMRCRAVRKARPFVTYFSFDLLFQNGRDLRPLPLIERKKRLRKLIPSDHSRLRYVDHIESEGEFVYKHAIANGLEGIVGKRADSVCRWTKV